MLEFLTRRRQDVAEVAALKAENARLRRERNQFEADRNAARAAEKSATVRSTTVDAANERLRRRNAELHARLQDMPHTEASREDIEAWERRAKASDAWTAPTGPDALLNRPLDGASARPVHPATELKRWQTRCLALEGLLARAEGRKPVTP